MLRNVFFVYCFMQLYETKWCPITFVNNFLVYKILNKISAPLYKGIAVTQVTETILWCFTRQKELRKHSRSQRPSRIPASNLCYMHVGNATGCHAYCQDVSRCHIRDESKATIVYRQGSTQVRDPPWLWNPVQTSPEVQNRGISGPTKRTHVLQN